MPNRKHRKPSKATPKASTFLFAFLGTMLFLLVFPASVPLTASAPAEAPRTVVVAQNSFPVALAVPVPALLVTAPVEIVTKKAVVVVPIPVKKVAEAHLLIPRIKVNAVIKAMGFTPEGAMAIPDNRIDVGWFHPGTLPGETGSAVIGGHNDWNGGAGVFVHLDQLAKGDRITVVDAGGHSTTFVVRETRTFNPTDIGTVIFDSPSGIHLNLITCSGVWDPKTNSYTKRLVVFADLVPEAI